MINLTWYQNNNESSPSYKQWYVRTLTRQMLGIHEMAQHMAEHNTPFSAGTIEGILTDFSRCIREQLLNGNSVKIDDLAIFKISVHSNLCTYSYGVNSTNGNLEAMPRLGSAVKRVRMVATATGDMMSSALGISTTFKWDTETQAKIDARRKEVLDNIGKLEAIGAQTLKEQQEKQDAGQEKPQATVEAKGESADDGAK